MANLNIMSLKELEGLLSVVQTEIIKRKRIKDAKQFLKLWSYTIGDILENQDKEPSEKEIQSIKNFIENHCEPEELELITGTYIGKHSTHMHCTTSLYLRDNYRLYYYSSEWAEGPTCLDVPNIKTMKEVVKPVSQEEIIKKLKSLGEVVGKFKEKFFLDFIHCLLFDTEDYVDTIDEWKNSYVERDHEFDELSY